MAELTQLQQETLDLFAKSELKDKFYWTGGTLLAVIYLHHRQSQDIDFFSDTPFSHDEVIGFINKLKEELQLDFVEEKKIYDRWEFFLHNKEEMRLEFVHYNHPKIAERAEWNGIKVDSFDDLAANKLMAMFDRNEPKDLFDIYFILTKGNYSLSALFVLVEKKFGVRLQESSVWSEAFRAMRELKNLKPLMIQENEGDQDAIIHEIETYFKTQSRKFLNQALD